MSLRPGEKMNFRLTPQRMAIMQCLQAARDHPSAEDIFRQVKRTFPTMSLATVYNTLDLLRERGVVSELTIDSRKRRYDSYTGPHHHLLCRSCGKIVDMCRQVDITLTSQEKEGFIVEGNHIEFYGTCPECL